MAALYQDQTTVAQPRAHGKSDVEIDGYEVEAAQTGRGSSVCSHKLV